MKYPSKRNPLNVFWLVTVTICFALTVIERPARAIQAAPGDLDPSFGVGGKVVTDFGRTNEQGFGIAVQTDGKVVVSGWVINGSAYDFLVVRYDKNGALDPTFGSGGKVYTDFFGTNDFANALAIQSDGKIVVAGSTANGFGGSAFGVARYNSNGSLDSGFGIGGKATATIGTQNEAYDVVIQSDGKIIVAGVADGPITYDFALVRYNQDGSLDAAFGNGGRVLTDLFGSTDVALAVGLDSKGRVIAAGFTIQSNETLYDFGVVRYNSNGTLDQSFGSNGKVKTDFFGVTDQGRDLAVQADDKIVVTGFAELPNSQRDFALARYNTNGSLDSSFGVNGRVTTSITNSFDQPEAIVIQPNGKIVVGGTALLIDGTTRNDFALVRYNVDGTVDQSFGNAGKVTTDFSTRVDQGEAIALQPDGKILLVGFSFDLSGVTGDDIIMARYIGDPTFGLCVQDDSSPNQLQINPTTGDYQFTDCLGLTLGGTGTLAKRGSLITLEHNAMDRRVRATIDGAANKAIATIQLLSQGRMFNITDRNISNDTCTCR